MDWLYKCVSLDLDGMVAMVVGMLVEIEKEDVAEVEEAESDDHRCTRQGSSLLGVQPSSFHESLQSAMRIFAMPFLKLMEWLPLVTAAVMTTMMTMLQQLPVGWNEDADYSVAVPDVVVLPH